MHWRRQGGHGNKITRAARQAGRSIARLGVLLVALATASCAGADPAARAAVAERDALRRELEGLDELRAIVARGVRADPAHALVVVRDSLVQGTLTAALPITVKPAQLEVTLERARVEFASNVTHVLVEGTVYHGTWPRIAASLTLRGALGEFSVDTAGSLGAKVNVDEVILRSPSGVPEAMGPAALGAMQNLVDRALPEIERVLPVVAIPVRLDQAITLPGFSAGGTLTVPPARAPLHIAVQRVASWNGRLWVVLLVRAGTFTRVSEADAGADSLIVDSTALTDSAARR